MYHMIFLFNPVWLNNISMNIYIRSYLQITSCIKKGVGVTQKVMFDDKGGRGGLGKSDFCDKGEGGEGLGYPKFA